MSAKYCPVGLCHGGSGARLPVEPAGLLCEYHRRKLSEPMADRLRWAQRDGELDTVLAQAVEEARKHDDRWPDFGVLVAGRQVEPFEGWRDAIRRAEGLAGERGLTVLISRTTFAAVPRDRAYVAVDRRGRMAGHGARFEDAIEAADESGSSFERIINMLTGETVEAARARAIMRRRKQ